MRAESTLGSNVEGNRYVGAMECDDYQRAAVRTARDKNSDLAQLAAKWARQHATSSR